MKPNCFCRRTPFNLIETFRRFGRMYFFTSTLMMEAVRSSEMLVNMSQTTRRHVSNRCDGIRSRTQEINTNSRLCFLCTLYK